MQPKAQGGAPSFALWATSLPFRSAQWASQDTHAPLFLLPNLAPRRGACCTCFRQPRPGPASPGRGVTRGGDSQASVGTGRRVVRATGRDSERGWEPGQDERSAGGSHDAAVTGWCAPPSRRLCLRVHGNRPVGRRGLAARLPGGKLGPPRGHVCRRQRATESKLQQLRAQVRAHVSACSCDLCARVCGGDFLTCSPPLFASLTRGAWKAVLCPGKRPGGFRRWEKCVPADQGWGRGSLLWGAGLGLGGGRGRQGRFPTAPSVIRLCPRVEVRGP